MANTKELIQTTYPDGSPLPHLRGALDIYAAFPKDDGSREQAIFLLLNEAQRYCESEGREYRPRDLVNAVVNAAIKQFGQRFVAGTVAIVLSQLINLGRQPSLKLAAEIVSEYAHAVDRIPVIRWNNGEWVETARAIVGDVDTIERVFRKYRRVSHICAAQVSCYEYLEALPPFEDTPEAEGCFINTVLAFQSLLTRPPEAINWNLIELVPPFPYDPSILPPLLPSEEVMQELFRPWQSSSRVS